MFQLNVSEEVTNLSRWMLNFEHLQNCGAIVCDCNVTNVIHKHLKKRRASLTALEN
jgi:hypothetical protein